MRRDILTSAIAAIVFMVLLRLLSPPSSSPRSPRGGRATSTEMRRDILTSAIAAIVFMVLLGLVYPLVITGVSQVTFPGNANGQQVHVGGKLVGSSIMGQCFSTPKLKNGKVL